MKLSILLFRALRFAKSRLPDSFFSKTPTLIISIVAVVYSCRFHSSALQPTSVEPTDVYQTQTATQRNATDDSRPVLSFRPENPGPNQELARIVNFDCNLKKDFSYTMTLDITLDSPFSQHSVLFDLRQESGEEHIDVALDQLSIAIAPNHLIERDVMRQLCEQLESGADSIESSDPRLVQGMSTWLKTLAPDCDVSPKNNGFWCELPSVDPSSANEALTDIRKTMIRSWSRQPYILTRRLSLSVMLTQALMSADRSLQLDKLCRIIAHSDPMELPLALANRRWQDAVCFQNNEDRIAAATVGLHKAVGEIEFLRQLFERTSKLGTLAIRLPRELVPTRDLWINLTPGPDVSTTLAQESEALGAKLSNFASRDFETPKACWHPLFGPDAYSLEIARYLDLSGEARGVRCPENHVPAATPMLSPSSYLSESITSETEFVITNGHAKMLRLPAGTYSYEIRGHYETLDQESAPDNVIGKGEITWASRRPNAAIRSLSTAL